MPHTPVTAQTTSTDGGNMCASSHVQPPELSMHSAITAIPALLRSFPMPTPVGVVSLSDVALSVGNPMNTAAYPDLAQEILEGARLSAATNAAMLKSSASPGLYRRADGGSAAADDGSREALSSFARNIVTTLMTDHAARLATISATATGAASSSAADAVSSHATLSKMRRKVKEEGETREGVLSANRVNDRSTASKAVKAEPPLKEGEGGGSVKTIGMQLRPRKSSVLPVEMQQSNTAHKAGKGSPGVPVKRERSAEAATSQLPLALGALENKGGEGAAVGALELTKKRRKDKVAGTPETSTMSPTCVTLFATTDETTTTATVDVMRCVRECILDPLSLVALINALEPSDAASSNALLLDASGRTSSGGALTADHIAHFLQSLTAPPPDNTVTDVFTITVRILAALTVMSNRVCSVSCVNEDILDQICTHCQSVVRALRKRLTDAQVERASAPQARSAKEHDWKASASTAGRGAASRPAAGAAAACSTAIADGDVVVGAAAPPAGSNRAGGHGSCFLSAEMPRLLAALRGVCRRLAAIAADASCGLLSQAHLVRLEEFCASVATVATVDPCVASVVSNYVVRDALLLYHILWNRIEEGRSPTVLLHRLTSDPGNILERCVEVDSRTAVSSKAYLRAKVMPWTLLCVAYAQSWPLFLSDVSHATVEAYARQLRGFVSAVVQHVLVPGVRDEGERRASWVVHFVEDLCALLGSPGYPGADSILRTLLFHLAATYLRPDSFEDSSESTTSGGDHVERLRTLVVDATGRVAVLLQKASEQLAASPIDTSVVEDALLSEWQLFLASAKPANGIATAVDAAGASTGKHESGSSKAPRKKQSRTDGHRAGPEVVAALPPLSVVERSMCTLYAALTERVSASTGGDVAQSAFWFHARRAFVFSWTHAKALPAAASTLTTLCRRLSNPVKSLSASQLDDDALLNIAVYLLTQQRKSILHKDARESLVSFLVNVVRAPAASDNMRKRSLRHISALLELNSGLLRVVWPTAVQAVRDDSARVRESSVPLLERILATTAKDAASAAASSSSSFASLQSLCAVAQNVVAALALLLEDRSAAVVAKAIAAAEGTLSLTPEQEAALFSNHEDHLLIRLLQTKLLLLLHHGEHGDKYHEDVATAFIQRWNLGGAALRRLRHGSSASSAATAGGSGGGASEVDLEAMTIGERALLLSSHGAARGVHADATEASGAVAETAKERMRTELPWLVCRTLAAPYEIGDGVPNAAVVLLEVLRQASLVSSFSSSGAASTARSKKALISPGPLQDSMTACAKDLIQHVLAASDAPGAGAEVGQALAAIHAMTIACAEWVAPLAEPVAALVSYEAGSAAATESDAVRIIQASRIMRTLFASSRSLSPDYVTAAVGCIIAKYTGMYQQRVLVAACALLCATVERSPTASSKQLLLWFQHVYSYFCRISTLLQQLTSKPTNSTSAGDSKSSSSTGHGGDGSSPLSTSTAATVGYVSRFVFLLSECLRSYRDWTRQDVCKALTESPSLPAGEHAKRMCRDAQSMSQNVQALVAQLSERCPTGYATKFMPLVVRLVGSLCIADPTTYFRRNELMISRALEARDDPQQQVQGLLLIRDFLLDEDARIARAASQKQSKAEKGSTAAVTTLIAGGRNRSTSQREDSTNPTGAEDLNSGMATWVVQRFHPAIVAKCCRGVSQLVRQLALDTLDIALQHGLIPPAVVCEALIGLCVDPDSEAVREHARRVLASVADRHEEALSTRASTGIVKAFDALVDIRSGAALQQQSMALSSVGSPLMQSSQVPEPTLDVGIWVQPPTMIQPHLCAHDLLFRLLSRHKKHRENLLVSLCRLLGQSAKLRACFDQPAVTRHTTGRDVGTASGSGLLRSAEMLLSPTSQSHGSPPALVVPVVPRVLGSFLHYLSTTIGFMPFSAESDVLLVLSHCTSLIDLSLQVAHEHLRSVVDAATAESQRSASAGAAAGGGPTGKPKIQRGTKAAIPTPLAAAASQLGSVGSWTSEAATADASSPSSDVSSGVPSELVYTCGGIVALGALKKYLRREYGISQAKQDRYGAAGSEKEKSSTAHLPRREPRSHSTEEFLRSLAALQDAMAKLSAAPREDISSRAHALRLLWALLDEVHCEACGALVLDGNPSDSRASKVSKDLATKMKAPKGKAARRKRNAKARKPRRTAMDEADNESEEETDSSDDSSTSETSSDGESSTA